MQTHRCPSGFQVGYDFGMHYDECKRSNCGNELYAYCRRYRFSCIGKADFGSKIIADMKAREMSVKGEVYGSYQCDFCDGWHIGRKREQ